jgi:hypothetical protein
VTGSGSKYQVKHAEKVAQWVHYCHDCDRPLDDKDLLILNNMIRGCRSKGHKVTTIRA